MVLTRNLYVGADVDRVIAAFAGASAETPGAAVQEAIRTLEVTHLPTRIAGFVDEIARHRPHVIGLQEVSIVEVPEAGYRSDFLEALTAALATRGFGYTAYASLNFDFTDLAGVGIRLADRDAILVADGLEVTGADSATYRCPERDPDDGLCLPLPSIGVLRRGWVRVTARINGRAITFVNTHLESGRAPGMALLRAGQAAELLAALGEAAQPMVLMGDLNDTADSPMHRVLVGAGFRDVWTALRPDEAGPTCCHTPDLRTAGLNRRIDYIMLRDALSPAGGGTLGGVTVQRLGSGPRDRRRGPAGRIWPSDHAGVVAVLSR